MPLYFAAMKCLKESVVSGGVAENATDLSNRGQVFLSIKCSFEVNLQSLQKRLVMEANYQTGCKGAIFCSIQCRASGVNATFGKSLWQRRTWPNSWNELPATQKLALTLFILQTSLCPRGTAPSLKSIVYRGYNYHFSLCSCIFLQHMSIMHQNLCQGNSWLSSKRPNINETAAYTFISFIFEHEIMGSNSQHLWQFSWDSVSYNSPSLSFVIMMQRKLRIIL